MSSDEQVQQPSVRDLLAACAAAEAVSTPPEAPAADVDVDADADVVVADLTDVTDVTGLVDADAEEAPEDGAGRDAA